MKNLALVEKIYICGARADQRRARGAAAGKIIKAKYVCRCARTPLQACIYARIMESSGESISGDDDAHRRDDIWQGDIQRWPRSSSSLPAPLLVHTYFACTRKLSFAAAHTNAVRVVARSIAGDLCAKFGCEFMRAHAASLANIRTVQIKRLRAARRSRRPEKSAPIRWCLTRYRINALRVRHR